MSRNSVTKRDLLPFLHKLKHQLWNERHYSERETGLAHSYLNKVIDRLEEYRE